MKDSYILFALKDSLVAIWILNAFSLFHRFHFGVFRLTTWQRMRENEIEIDRKRDKKKCVVRFVHQLHKFSYGCGLRQYSTVVEWHMHEHPTETPCTKGDTKERKTAANKDLVSFSCCAIMNAKFTLALQHSTSAVYLLKWLWSIIHTEFQCKRKLCICKQQTIKLERKRLKNLQQWNTKFLAL